VVAYNNSILPHETEDNYILSTKGLVAKGLFFRRNVNSQTINHDGTSDTSSSVKEKK
jgi:hypothetical protein